MMKGEMGMTPEKQTDATDAKASASANAKQVRIEPGTVQETLIIPLYGRKLCGETFPELYSDPYATRLCEGLDYDFSALDAKAGSLAYRFGALEAAMRQLDIMWEVRDYLESHPNATIVNLGCGLDQTGRACDNGTAQLVNIDFPDIIAIRNDLLGYGERERNLAFDLNDQAWMDEIDPTGGVVLFAAGVFHYFTLEQVKTLVLAMQKRFPGGRLVFDSVGKVGFRLMMGITLKSSGMGSVEGSFALDDPVREIASWAPDLTVSSRGYMLGYHPMEAPGIGWLFRTLAKLADGPMHMQVSRVEL